MSHDFAKGKGGKKKAGKNASKAQAPQGLPGWVLFFSGVAFTLFAQFIYHLATLDTTGNVDIDNAIETTKQQTEAIKKPVINFYNTLKEQEVKVSDEVVDQREQEDYNYALQAGSFRNRDDANQQRAEVMLLGLNAEIETRTAENGTVWNKIIVGPFTSRSELSSARSTLINNGMPTMKIKRN